MIFCVEDDSSIRELMIYALTAAGFEARGFADGSELVRALESNLPELITLDIMLPGEDGISILKRLKADPKTAYIPVIMASAKGEEYDRIIGLDLGADDYLTKPFGMMEMVSRVRAVLRRSVAQQGGADSEEVFRVGTLELNAAAHTVTADRSRVQLTLKEFELLRLFMENEGRVLTREQLLGSVWGTDFAGESRTVDVHIGSLRTKLGACGEYIETVRGVGYIMEKRQ